jgi:peroxiredoxin Q/BCP
VFGASADKVELNQQFTDKNSYTFPLLSDPDLKLIQALGIQSPKGKVAQRVTFVIDKDGKVAKIYDKVTPKDHPKEVLAFVKELAKK